MSSTSNKPAAKTSGAVLYTRVSTGEQDKHGTSPETQRAACRAKALALSLPVVAEYYDGGISGGFLLSRREFQAAIADIREGRADTLICPNIGRYSRDVEHQQSVKKAVRAAGGRLVFCDAEYEDNAAGDLNFDIQGSFAAYERKLIRERTMGGRRRKSEQGIQTAMHAPYGYQIPTKADVIRGDFLPEMFGKHVQVPEHARHVRRMFLDCDAGKSLHQIRRELTAEGVPTIKGGPEWGMTTIARILHNPVYKGTHFAGTVETYTDESRLLSCNAVTGAPYVTARAVRPAPEERWLLLPVPPIVDKALWDRVQERLAVNKARRGGQPGQARMLSGRLFCPECGAKMSPRIRKCKDGTQTVYYTCVRYVKSLDTGRARDCKGDVYPLREVEAAVITAVLAACRQPESIAAAIAQYRERCHQGGAGGRQEGMQAADVRKEMVALDRALREAGQEEAAAVQAQIAGIRAGASPDAYAQVFAEVAARRKDLLDRRGVLKGAEARLRGADAAPMEAQHDAHARDFPARMLTAARNVLGSGEVSGEVKRDILGTIVRGVVCRRGGADVTFVPGLFGGVCPPEDGQVFTSVDTLHVTEVSGMAGEVVSLQDVFRWEARGVDAEGRAQGALRSTGLRPAFSSTLEAQGLALPPELFS